MFEHPKVYGADQYIVQVSEENKKEPFLNPVAEGTDSSTAIMFTGFKFSNSYKWRYAGVRNGKNLGWNGPYSFNILSNGRVDTSQYRFRLIDADEGSYGPELIVLDQARTIVDRKGNFVWFLPPDADSITFEGVNDLRVTRAGDLTFLEGKKALKTDLNGNLLWMAPSSEQPSNQFVPEAWQPYNYHHCFKQLSNGNFMVIDKVFVADSALLAIGSGSGHSAVIPFGVQSVAEISGKPTTPQPQVVPASGSNALQFDVIREFDKKGKPVWTWNAKDYFTSSEIKYMLTELKEPGVLGHEPGGHLNAFDVDEKNGFVYVSFRNISRIVKIDLNSGKALHTWGNKIANGGANDGNGFFSMQHGVSLLADGSIAVFSNGIWGNGFSEVALFSQSPDVSADKMLWKFNCLFDGKNEQSRRGGSIEDLKNGNLLVCTGATNRVFEITRNKKIVWQGIIEQYDHNNCVWQSGSLSMYKANYISSLYPCYFTIKTSRDTLMQNATSFQLKIFNNGSENDQYIISISSSNGDYKKQINSEIVKNGASVTFEIVPDREPVAQEDITISVISKSNADFVRRLSIPFLKPFDLMGQ